MVGYRRVEFDQAVLPEPQNSRRHEGLGIRGDSHWRCCRHRAPCWVCHTRRRKFGSAVYLDDCDGEARHVRLACLQCGNDAVGLGGLVCLVLDRGFLAAGASEADKQQQQETAGYP